MTTPGFKDLFSEAAAGYARHRPSYPIAVVDALAGIAPSRAVAWDCGCGSGQLSTMLAKRFARVIATDASRAQVDAAPAHERIDYRVAEAEASGIEDGTVDLAVAAQAAHWFDLPRYYAEVRRVATPGAAIALVTYALMRVTPEIDVVIDDFYTRVLAPFWPVERRHVDTHYRSLAFPFDEIPMPPIEMRTTWAVADVEGYVGTWSAVRAMTKAEGRARVDAFLERLRAVWGDQDSARTARLAITIRAGRVSPLRS